MSAFGNADLGCLPPEPQLCSAEEMPGLEIDNLATLAEHTAVLAGQWQKNYEFSPALVRRFNEIALAGIYASAGQYRTYLVTAGDFVPASYREINAFVSTMCEYVNRLIDDPFYAAAYLLWRVNWIHPFAEGNGRTARELCLLALQVGIPSEHSVVWDLMAGLMANDRDKYYQRLKAADRLCADLVEKCAEPVESFLLDLYYTALSTRAGES